MKKTILRIFVLVLPLVVLAGMATNASMQRHGGQSWQIKITGYDPRDLLYGHYLTFRYDWNWENEMPSSPMKIQDSCLCLNSSETGTKNPRVRPVECRASSNQRRCISVIKAVKYGNGYSFNRDGIRERYFIPEENSSTLDRALRQDKHEFHVELVAHDNHSVAVRDLYVDGVKLETFLRNLPKEEK